MGETDLPRSEQAVCHPVDMLERACDITDRIMSGVQPRQPGKPTPCRDWTVRELMEHVVASTDFFAEAHTATLAQHRDDKGAASERSAQAAGEDGPLGASAPTSVRRPRAAAASRQPAAVGQLSNERLARISGTDPTRRGWPTLF